jgi:hypothetical protein
MRSIKEQLVLVYCLVDEGLKSEKNGGNWRKSNNKPKCTDAEIIAVAMMQSYFGCATLKRAYLLVKANDPQAFPHLPGYKQWLARWHQLSFQMGAILESVPLNITDLEEIYLIDSFPIPMCQAIRHGRVNLLRDDGAYARERNKRMVFRLQIARFINADRTNRRSGVVADQFR